MNEQNMLYITAGYKDALCFDDKIPLNYFEVCCCNVTKCEKRSRGMNPFVRHSVRLLTINGLLGIHVLSLLKSSWLLWAPLCETAQQTMAPCYVRSPSLWTECEAAHNGDEALFPPPSTQRAAEWCSGSVLGPLPRSRWLETILCYFLKTCDVGSGRIGSVAFSLLSLEIQWC